MNNKINTISVIGAGFMGRMIVEKSALYGYNLNIFDTNPEGLDDFINNLKKKN